MRNEGNMFKLFQVHLTDEEVAQVNATGHDSVPKQKARLQASVFGDPSEAIAGGFFEHVANIDALTLEGVFHIGNQGPEEKIERLGPMSSTSVGDIVEDPDGKQWVVAKCGFDPIEEKIVC
jgi:hypothetical protein